MRWPRSETRCVSPAYRTPVGPPGRLWDVASLWIYVVGLGKTIVQEHDWQGDCPEQGPKALRLHARSRSTRLLIAVSPHAQRHGNVMSRGRRQQMVCRDGEASEYAEKCVPESPKVSVSRAAFPCTRGCQRNVSRSCFAWWRDPGKRRSYGRFWG